MMMIMKDDSIDVDTFHAKNLFLVMKKASFREGSMIAIN